MNKYRFLSVGALAVLLFLAPAVELWAAPPLLGEILNRTEANYQKIQAFTAVFRQTTTSAALGTVSPAEAVGRLYYAKPRQMRWEYDKPEEQVFVANNRQAWLYVPADNQVSLFDAGKLLTSPLAQTFFDGVVGLKNNFDVSLDSAQSTKSSAVLKLIPKKEDPNVKMLYLWIDLQTFRITRIETLDLLGNTNRIVLETFSPMQHLDPVLFQLNVPSHVRVFNTEGRELTPSEVEQLKAEIASSRR